MGMLIVDGSQSAIDGVVFGVKVKGGVRTFGFSVCSVGVLFLERLAASDLDALAIG